ncbi:RcnB family protein [Sphingomonas melonis]|jgi:Ni/Co efflux regulator RcnB|uniref:Ni/Co efflux regulator RcnB n=1 Tax=Sphingomonas melonis TaxID=152682 RepID=A0A7Y9FN09_9SPHN|nr:RcnB family protein [Sphingomonas melonis]NYD90296.1 Ni/Co efflux regulator RcnB [Sphingomonas melonis]
MKKLILSAIAATLVASPMALAAADAAPVQRERTVTTVKERPNGRTVVTQRTVVRNDRHGGPRNWRTGQRFDRRYATNYRVVRDYRTYRLAAPPRGAYWARSGNDAVLVRDNGTVVRVIQRSFR